MTPQRNIKKYPNRRLYDTEISSYSTLDRARSAYRQPSPAETTHARLGFRVVREL